MPDCKYESGCTHVTSRTTLQHGTRWNRDIASHSWGAYKTCWSIVRTATCTVAISPSISNIWFLWSVQWPSMDPGSWGLFQKLLIMIRRSKLKRRDCHIDVHTPQTVLPGPGIHNTSLVQTRQNSGSKYCMSAVISGVLHVCIRFWLSTIR